MVLVIWEFAGVERAMRFKLALLLAVVAVLLTGCGYWIVEDAPVLVGSAHCTQVPAAP